MIATDVLRKLSSDARGSGIAVGWHDFFRDDEGQAVRGFGEHLLALEEDIVLLLDAYRLIRAANPPLIDFARVPKEQVSLWQTEEAARYQLRGAAYRAVGVARSLGLKGALPAMKRLLDLADKQPDQRLCSVQSAALRAAIDLGLGAEEFAALARSSNCYLAEAAIESSVAYSDPVVAAAVEDARRGAEAEVDRERRNQLRNGLSARDAFGFWARVFDQLPDPQSQLAHAMKQAWRPSSKDTFGRLMGWQVVRLSELCPEPLADAIANLPEYVPSGFSAPDRPMRAAFLEYATPEVRLLVRQKLRQPASPLPPVKPERRPTGPPLQEEQ
jgi:hypothetical protein